MSKKIKKFLKNTEKKLNHLDRVIRSVKADCDKLYVVIMIDMFICYLMYFVNIDEYKVLEFYKMTHTMRKTFLNEIKHNFYKRFLYKKDIIGIIKNKNKFLNRFKSYIKYELVNVNDISYKRFEELLLENKKVLCRSANRDFVSSYEVYDLSKFRGVGFVFEKIKNNKILLCQKNIILHKKLNEISNNLVVIIFVTMINNGKVDLVSSYVSFKEDGEVIRGYIDIKKSCVKGHLRNSKYNIHDMEIINYEIPKMDEMIDYVTKCALEIEEIKEVEWSLCLDNRGKILLMDANTWDNYIFAQIPEFLGKKSGLDNYYRKIIFK